MNNVYNEPKYDTDPANKGYVDSQSQHIINVINGVEEDTNNKLNRKTQNFGSQPTPPYRVNDTWMNGNDIYICVRERLIGDFVDSDWEKASKYDNTKSILDGGVTTNGTLVVARGGTVAAGLTAYTEGDDGVRIWAGSDINGINSAPFRVLQNGSVFMTKANITGGTIKVHGNQTQSLIKAYVDGYENSVYSEITPNYISIHNDLSHKYGSLGNMFGDLTLQISEQVDSDNSIMSSLSSSYLMILKQSGSNQISTWVKPEEVETPKIVAGNMDCGTCTLNSSSDTTVSFNKTFASPPIVVLTPKVNGTAVGACYSASVARTTTTDFTAYCLTNLNSSGNITFNWIAIGT